MTLNELRESDKALLTPKEVASALGLAEQGLRVQAHENPAALGVPVVITGRKGRSVRIPRLPLMRYLGIEQ